MLLLALTFDITFGEPPANWHPVIWMGRLVAVWKRFAPAQGRIWPFVYGLLVVVISTSMVFAGSWWLLDWMRRADRVIPALLEIFLLKSCFSLKMLGDEGLKIRRLLAKDDLSAARYEMRSLVSRDTSSLDGSQLCGAAIESVTENSTDSVIAPIFFYALFGVPGALAYRLVNTFDSMIGYRGQYEYLGKFAARLDDVLNYIPARLTALLLIVSAPWYRGNRERAWQVARRDHSKTASPNAGWTMAAMAGALGIQLEKVGHYLLGDPDPAIPLRPNLISRAVAALYIVSAEIVALYALVALLRFLIFI